MVARDTSSNKSRGQPQRQPQTGPPGAKAATSGARALPQHQTRKSAARPSTTSTTASPTNARPATAPPPRHNHVVFTHKAKADETDILWKALQKHPVKSFPNQPKWFDGYDSLDRKLLVEYGKHKDYEKTILAHLPILVEEKNGTQHNVGLQHAVRDTISYLLDVEAMWNPVSAIANRPQGFSKDLWNGRLYLGGIKDSENVDGVLNRLKIDAVVSIHPKDWLTDECWKDLFHKWDGDPRSLRLKNSKPMQYHIELQDDSTSDLLGYFKTAFEFMNEFLIAQGKNVLVHCKMGQSRSASLVLGYMMDRYYRTYFEILDANKRPSPEIISTKLQDAQKVFPSTWKRKGANTQKFDVQLSQYAQYLAEGEKGPPPKPPKPAETKAGGGIIKGAAMVLCFMCNLEPTDEILVYWSKLKDETTHYWKAASQDKALKEGIRVNDHLATFNGFFEAHRNPTPGQSGGGTISLM